MGVLERRYTGPTTFRTAASPDRDRPRINLAITTAYQPRTARCVMRMGNLFTVGRRRSSRIMTIKTPTLGIDHLTVVPANFEPERRGADG